MKKLVFDNYEDMSRGAADIYVEQLAKKPNSVLGLATGSTPIGLYNELVKRYNEKKIDFSKAISFNLDEYYPIKNDHPQSYKVFMYEHLFSKVNFAAINLINGEALDPDAECKRYDAAIDAAGGIDLQLLGIGLNGHIAFIEPADVYHMNTHIEQLSQVTLDANQRFFNEGEIQPPTAISVGLDKIFKAKKIIQLISGAAKAEIVRKLFDDKLYTDIPACLLKLHPDVTILLDKAAAGE